MSSYTFYMHTYREKNERLRKIRREAGRKGGKIGGRKGGKIGGAASKSTKKP